MLQALVSGRACRVQGRLDVLWAVAAWEQWKQKEENRVKGEADAALLLNGGPPSEQSTPSRERSETRMPLRSLR